MSSVHWDSDSKFGFTGPSAGATAAAPAPGAPAGSQLAPARNAVHALLDPRGSAIFWVAAAAILGLAMVSGQLSIAAKVRTRAGK